MKLAIKTLAVAGLALVLAARPSLAGDGKTFDKKIIVEEDTKWWGAALSTGWDSLYMFRGVNVLSNDHYGSGIYWTDLSFTWNITENDSLSVGTWIAFGTGSTDYKELDVYTDYTHTWGDFSLSFGYVFYDVWSSPVYSHELSVTAAYEFDLGFMTLTPSLFYAFNVGPGLDNGGFTPEASSWLAASVTGNIPVYKKIIAIAPWITFGTNFRYNSNDDGHFFTGANNLELGIGIPVQINDVISLYAYGAYSNQWYNLLGTEPSTFWGGASVTFSF